MKVLLKRLTVGIPLVVIFILSVSVLTLITVPVYYVFAGDGWIVVDTFIDWADDMSYNVSDWINK